MKIDTRKLDMELARECMSLNDIRGRGIHPLTLSKIRNNPEYQPTTKTIGKIARALNVDVTAIIKQEA